MRPWNRSSRSPNCDLVGLSIDSIFGHIAWLRTIREKIEYKGMKGVEVNFPLISRHQDGSREALRDAPAGGSSTQAVRAVFIVDPNGVIRALLYYPLTNGRNMEEIKRLLVALQTSDKHAVATPANWQPGEDVIIPTPGSCGAARERVEKPGADTKVLDWFLVLKKGPHGKNQPGFIRNNMVWTMGGGLLPLTASR